MSLDCPLAPYPFLPPCRGKARMGVEPWGSPISTPSQALPLAGGELARGQDVVGIEQSHIFHQQVFFR